MKNLLVALDLTPASESVLPYVATLIPHRTGRIALAHVVPRKADASDRAGAALEDLSLRPELKGAPVDTVLLAGDPAEEIVRLSTAGPYDLLVLCSRGKSGVRRLLLGSVAEKIMRTAAVPVLVVHPLGRKRPAPVRRILVPFDGSRRAATALPPAVELARAWNAQIVLLTVTPDEDVRPPLPTRLALENLSKTAKKLRSQGLSVDVAARPGDPALEILRFAAENAVDLIALSTHGRTGLARLAYGSVAERVLRKSTFPLLVVRSAGVPRAHRAHARAAERAARVGRETRDMQSIGAGPYRG